MSATPFRNLILIVALFSAAMLSAQDFTFKNYNWDDKPGIIQIPEQYKNQNEVILEKNLKTEIVVVGSTAKEYMLVHEKIYINSDDAIERNNKAYIPFTLNESVLENKVRVILKSGKIINLNKKDIKEETDEEKGVKYNYFAINGLEKGAVIEKIYILDQDPKFDGATIKMQTEYPIASLSYELIFPEHLSFKTRVMNGLSEPISDDKKFPGKKILAINEKDIPALDDDQKYSNWNGGLRMFRYKLDANLANGGRNLYNFKEFATNVYERLNPELDKREQKAVADFCASIPKSSNAQEQIWNIENKIKKTINYDRYIDRKNTIAEILKTKQANQTDIMKLYCAVFRNFGIENNVVLTSDRFKVPFDSTFESYENLSELLYYFPSISKYMTPTEVEYRIPLIPSGLASNNGLFIKEKKFAGVNMGIGEIKFIDIPGMDITHDVMEITVDFSKDAENPLVTNRIEFGGYSALSFQPIKDFTSADQYKTILRDIAKNFTADGDYKTLTSANDGVENIGKKPFILEVTFEGKDLIKKAGANYLFSVGQLIGKQSELYQERPRTLPVEIDNPHSYLRKIKIILPKGVKIMNPEKLGMDYKMNVAGKTEAAFTSNYKTDNEIVSIENTEFYNSVNYPMAQFSQYRDVINAAADFNKVVLIMGK